MSIHALRAQAFTGNKPILIPTRSGRTAGILPLAGLDSGFVGLCSIEEKTQTNSKL